MIRRIRKHKDDEALYKKLREDAQLEIMLLEPQTLLFISLICFLLFIPKVILCFFCVMTILYTWNLLKYMSDTYYEDIAQIEERRK
jgi:hypothetical protein